MSDVSKTNEALEKLALAAEDAAGGPPSAEQVDALIAYADALRDALEAKTGIRVDMSSAVGVETQLAAARVPVQGEPNGDLELRTLAEGMKAAKEKLYDIGTGVGGLALDHPELYEAYSKWDDLSDDDHADTVLALLDRLAARAAVPDAATAELRADTMTADEAISSVLKRPGMYGLVLGSEHRSMKAERDAATEVQRAWIAEDRAKLDLADVEAERDAALAAIERVRAIHFPMPIIEAWGKSISQSDDFPVCVECTDGDNDWCAWPCPTVVVLDGAPEPEWEYEYADDDDPDGNVYGQLRRIVGPWEACNE